MGRSRDVRKRVRRTSSQIAADIAAASAADKKAGARLKAALKIGSSIKQKPPAASAPASVPAASASASLARSIPSRQSGDLPRVGENRWTDPNRADGIEGVPRGWVAVVNGMSRPTMMNWLAPSWGGLSCLEDGARQAVPSSGSQLVWHHLVEMLSLQHHHSLLHHHRRDRRQTTSIWFSARLTLTFRRGSLVPTLVTAAAFTASAGSGSCNEQIMT